MGLAPWSGDRVVEGARLESECTLPRVPGVRIPPTPLFMGRLSYFMIYSLGNLVLVHSHHSSQLSCRAGKASHEAYHTGD